MTPTRCVAEAPRAGLKTKLAVSLGPFYGPATEQWAKGLKERDESWVAPEAQTREQKSWETESSYTPRISGKLREKHKHG